MRCARARVVPGFRAALDLHLVETSPAPASARRRATLRGDVPMPLGTSRSTTCRDGPAIVIANEFFDALPIRQFVAHGDGWRERVVGLDAAGKLAFVDGDRDAGARRRCRHAGATRATARSSRSRRPAWRWPPSSARASRATAAPR